MPCELTIGESALITDIAMCINHYRLSSPGLYVCTHATVQLDDTTKMYPDVLAMVNYGKHKQCDPDSTYSKFVGAPNFIVDVFPANEWLDYEERWKRYEQAGVKEYIALQDTESLTWIWNRLINDEFTQIDEDDSGIIRSSAMPGLWVPVDALKQRNWWIIMASIAQGVTRRKHHDLMDTIWK